MTVSFEEAALSVFEGSSLQVCTAMSLPAERLVSADITIVGGSAQLTADFVLSPSTQTLTFEIGSTRSCVTVQAIDDFSLESDEDFTLSLESSDVFVVISPTDGSSLITIPNENSKKGLKFELWLHINCNAILYNILAAVNVAFQSPTYVVEEGTSGQVCGQLSSGAAIPVTVALLVSDNTALENVDFTISSQSITFPPGSILSCTNVLATDDSILEGDESFSLTLVPELSAVLPTGTATVTIPNRNSMLREKSFHDS